MDEIYDFLVITFYSIKKQLSLFSHIQDKIFQDCIFCITNCMNFHNHVIVQSVHFFYPQTGSSKVCMLFHSVKRYDLQKHTVQQKLKKMHKESCFTSSYPLAVFFEYLFWLKIETFQYIYEMAYIQQGVSYCQKCWN